VAEVFILLKVAILRKDFSSCDTTEFEKLCDAKLVIQAIRCYFTEDKLFS
jgi:hypothetical protein